MKMSANLYLSIVFVICTASLFGAAASQDAQQQDAAKKKEVIAYPLNICAVAGSELGSMGDPVVKVYDGREVKFCCAACVGKFEADKAKSFKKLDEMIAKDQLRYYPTSDCFIMGDPLIEDGKDISIDVIHNNRLVRLCCPMCVRRFNAKTDEYLKQLDEMIIKAQRKDYPLKTCVVAGQELGSMGEPVEMIVAGRLVRLCCAACKGKVQADPAKYLAKIDKAWQDKGMFMPEKDAKGN